MGKGLGVGVNAAGSRRCTSLTGHRDGEMNRSLLGVALGAMLCLKTKETRHYLKQKTDEVMCSGWEDFYPLPVAFLRSDAPGSVRLWVGDHMMMTDSEDR